MPDQLLTSMTHAHLIQEVDVSLARMKFEVSAKGLYGKVGNLSHFSEVDFALTFMECEFQN